MGFVKRDAEVDSVSSRCQYSAVARTRWNKKWRLYSLHSGGGRVERVITIVGHKSTVRNIRKKIVCNERIIALKLEAEPVVCWSGWGGNFSYNRRNSRRGLKTRNKPIEIGGWKRGSGNKLYRNTAVSHVLVRRSQTAKLLWN
jgi:hypothetical protein